MLIGPANPILVAMPLQNIHPDLKLGLVLVVAAAALLKFANSNVLLAFVAAQRLNIVPESFGWLMLAGGIGGLAVVGAAIWVDWRPPHILMAGGAVVVALSLTVVGLSNSFVVSALGMFVAGVGGSAVGSLVFYAVAVKGATRYRGTLIGALGLVFTMSLGVGDVGDWLFDSPMLLLAVSGALTLAGAAVLFLLLPRVFAGSYEPGPTLRETLSMPSVRRAAAWITAAFFIAALVRASGGYILFFIARSASGVEDITLPFQTIPIFSGIGALLWGVASDFYPARRLFLLAALLILAVLAAFWPFFGYPASDRRIPGLLPHKRRPHLPALGVDGGTVAPASLREDGAGHLGWRLSGRRTRHDLVDHSEVLLGRLCGVLGRRPGLLVRPRGGHNPCYRSQPPAETAGDRNPAGISGTKEVQKRERLWLPRQDSNLRPSG